MKQVNSLIGGEYDIQPYTDLYGEHYREEACSNQHRAFILYLMLNIYLILLKLTDDYEWSDVLVLLLEADVGEH